MDYLDSRERAMKALMGGDEEAVQNSITELVAFIK
jgi:hypothetical protein